MEMENDEEREAGSAVAGGEAIIGATLDGLRRAAAEVEQVASAAETLQRALLPADLPEIAGLTFAGRYLSAGEEAQVGGDWYDVIALRDGRAGIAIGDVVGHGVEAAARMAHLQSATRAFALEGMRPSLVLERVSGFAYDAPGPSMATLLYGIVDAESATLRIASAAHPPPLVLAADGSTSFVESPRGNPLGARQYPAYEEVSVIVGPGDTVVLFTDGLVESPQQSLDSGLRELGGDAVELSHDPDGLCDGLLERRFGAKPPNDDVAVLAIRFDPVAEETFEMSLPAEPDSLGLMRRSIGRWLKGAGATDDEAYDVLVAAGEACANAIAHAYPIGSAAFEVSARKSFGSVEVEVRDFGSWRDPRPGTSGRGIALMRELMDDVDLERRLPGGTTVKLRRRLAARSAA
jgi:serine phosphatase RsbU (regulator of sigma subunit)/anti-sigma regulatory factor (Ser/Thr protein kinase)